MKPLKLADHVVIDDSNAMDHEKAILADAHEASLSAARSRSICSPEMALRLRRLITLTMAQQHALTTLEERYASCICCPRPPRRGVR